MDKKHDHVLHLKVQKTSVGYLGQTLEIPSVIIEAPTKEELVNKILLGVNCYIKSFPEEHDKIFPESVAVEQIAVTV